MRKLLLTILLVCTISACYASEEVQVSWLTCSPGTEVYELEGHTALRIRSAEWGDVVVNWGVFDFASDAFVWRFALGQTDYICAAAPTWAFLSTYQAQGRTVTEQVLRLTPQQAERLCAMIDSTLQPGARTYRYNYVLDNCATRPLDYIEQAVGQRVVMPADSASCRTTFRREMRRYHKDYPWYQLGIDLALGSGIDKPITHRQEGFAPVAMSDMLAEASVIDSTGNSLSIVVSTETLVTPLSPAPAPASYPHPLAVALVIVLLVIVAVVIQLKRNRIVGWVYVAYFMLEAIAGLLLTFLIFVSTHYATSPNYNYLWLNPLALIPAIGMCTRGRWKNVQVLYHAFNIICIAALAVIFIAGVQSANVAFIPLMAASALLSIAYLIIWKRKRNIHSVTVS